MKKIIAVFVIVLCVSGFSVYRILQDPYLKSQIRSIAEVIEPGYLLTILDHISVTPRPKETFQFPIAVGEVGPSQPLYSGSKQYPFYCMTEASRLGQPMVDNQDMEGVPVYQLDKHQQKTGTIIGYSRDCLARTHFGFYYREIRSGRLEPYDLSSPPQLAQINQVRLDGKLVDEIYRVEQGTINRFIYTIAMLASLEEGRLGHGLWNHRLIYQFQGGVGVGFRQGKQSATKLIKKRIEQLKLGYAVISSTANKTSYTYNMLLAEDTAKRVKLQFVALYGEPIYTIGIGGSGGGLAQYLLAQNGAGIIDAAMPLYSYPDMVTQTIYVLDCDLLNNYYGYRADEPELYQDWSRRAAIEGMNALEGFPQKVAFLEPLNQLLSGRWPRYPTGNSECINGWLGLSSLINNPRQGFLRSFFSNQVKSEVDWSYWEDLQALFGRDEQGFAQSTWDNVGVQYGLQALQQGKIDFDEFIRLNREIGAWRSQLDMQEEWFWTPLGRSLPLWLSLWGRHNITEVNQGLARRHQGNIEAMTSAYRSGQVFIGKIDIPVLDIRHYLESELNMHHLSASFNSRVRILQYHGDARHHLIWVAHKDHNPLARGFEVMDQWMLALLTDPQRDMLAAKPKDLSDSCFGADGEVIASGNGVWDGPWNNQPSGACTRIYPAYSNVRIAAGAPWDSSIFKCHLQSTDDATAMGMYGNRVTEQELQQLTETFPTGVCNYALGDAGRPDMLSHQQISQLLR